VLDSSAHLRFLANALEEDLGRGDPTTLALVPEGARATADLVVKESGVVAGLPLVEPLIRILDADATVEPLAKDGDAVAAGTVVAVVRGRARAVLSAERTALNVVRRLSGVATLSRRFVEAARGLRAASGAAVEIVDTRKTTPGWRDLEKYAVTCGGASNHRLRLDDAAMIKENHLLEAFGRTGPDAVREGTARVRAAIPREMRLYVEVEDEAEMHAAVEAGADVVMCDGWEPAALARAVAWVKRRPAPRPLLEATGGVTLDTVRAIAATGVDRISVGALTHSAPALDLSLRHRARA
jgi:nicotinate-nucleotide pyrophosphorylase (carboxylating)